MGRLHIMAWVFKHFIGTLILYGSKEKAAENFGKVGSFGTINKKIGDNKWTIKSLCECWGLYNREVKNKTERTLWFID